MSSILISFVGKQDPASEATNQPGSIVSLVKHLLEDSQIISRIILLYTLETKEAAKDTEDWLLDLLPELKIVEENIELIPVEKKLSQDPVDFLLAIQTARQSLEKAKSYLNEKDFLELNASSGTPAMKSTWSILQAAGYAPQSRVWQVRNPDTKELEQRRVFQTNVDILKKEFDLKIIQQQINNYNYSGALANFQESSLKDNGITILLEYGRCRLACDFNAARQKIHKFREIIGSRLSTEIDHLASHNQKYFIVELYFHALIKLQNKEYCNFLVLVFAFQESVLRFQVRKRLCPEFLNTSWRKAEDKVEEAIQKYQEGELYNYLQDYRLPNNHHINRPVMLAILDYFEEKSPLLDPLKKLNKYCDQRNDFVHQFQGVSFLEDRENLVNYLHKIARQITSIPKENSFDLLNQQLHSLLSKSS